MYERDKYEIINVDVVAELNDAVSSGEDHLALKYFIDRCDKQPALQDFVIIEWFSKNASTPDCRHLANLYLDLNAARLQITEINKPDIVTSISDAGVVFPIFSHETNNNILKSEAISSLNEPDSILLTIYNSTTIENQIDFVNQCALKLKGEERNLALGMIEWISFKGSNEASHLAEEILNREMVQSGSESETEENKEITAKKQKKKKQKKAKRKENGLKKKAACEAAVASAEAAANRAVDASKVAEAAAVKAVKVAGEAEEKAIAKKVFEEKIIAEKAAVVKTPVAKAIPARVVRSQTEAKAFTEKQFAVLAAVAKATKAFVDVMRANVGVPLIASNVHADVPIKPSKKPPLKFTNKNEFYYAALKAAIKPTETKIIEPEIVEPKIIVEKNSEPEMIEPKKIKLLKPSAAQQTKEKAQNVSLSKKTEIKQKNSLAMPQNIEQNVSSSKQKKVRNKHKLKIKTLVSIPESENDVEEKEVVPIVILKKPAEVKQTKSKVIPYPLLPVNSVKIPHELLQLAKKIKDKTGKDFILRGSAVPNIHLNMPSRDWDGSLDGSEDDLRKIKEIPGVEDFEDRLHSFHPIVHFNVMVKGQKMPVDLASLKRRPDQSIDDAMQDNLNENADSNMSALYMILTQKYFEIKGAPGCVSSLLKGLITVVNHNQNVFWQDPTCLMRLLTKLNDYAHKNFVPDDELIQILTNITPKMCFDFNLFYGLSRKQAATALKKYSANYADPADAIRSMFDARLGFFTALTDVPVEAVDPQSLQTLSRYKNTDDDKKCLIIFIFMLMNYCKLLKYTYKMEPDDAYEQLENWKLTGVMAEVNVKDHVFLNRVLTLMLDQNASESLILTGENSLPVSSEEKIPARYGYFFQQYISSQEDTPFYKPLCSNRRSVK